MNESMPAILQEKARMLAHKWMLQCSAVLGLATMGCTQKNATALKGHFENYTAEQLMAYEGKLRIIPEYAASSGVIVTFGIVAHGMGGLFESLLAHPDKPKIYMMISPEEEASARKFIAALQSKIAFEDARVSLIAVPENAQSDDRDFTWARDWAPWSAAVKSDEDREELRFVEFNYLSDTRMRADAIPQILSKNLHVARVSIPIRTEGGNFMANSRGDCVMTTNTFAKEDDLREKMELVGQWRKDLEEKKRKSSGSEIYKQEIAGEERRISAIEQNVSMSRAYSPAEIEQAYRSFLGCKRLIAFAPSPADYNGHIDLFAKFIDDDTIVVADLEEATINLARSKLQVGAVKAPYLDFLSKVRAHLNDSATRLGSKGFKVVRVPMPLPYSYVESKKDHLMIDGDYSRQIEFGAYVTPQVGRLHMRSYVNSLILNKKVFVPRFKSPEVNGGYAPFVLGFPVSFNRSYVDGSLLVTYEEKVKKAYASAGLEAIFVDADVSPYASGSIHCMTMQLGKLE